MIQTTNQQNVAFTKDKMLFIILGMKVDANSHEC